MLFSEGSWLHAKRPVRVAETMKDRIFAAAVVGSFLCVMSVAAAVQYGGTMWVFGWIAGIAFVGTAIGLALSGRG